MPDSFAKFSKQAGRVLALAGSEARCLNHPSIDSEHMLVSLIEVEDGASRKILGRLGIAMTQVQQLIEELIGTFAASG